MATNAQLAEAAAQGAANRYNGTGSSGGKTYIPQKAALMTRLTPSNTGSKSQRYTYNGTGTTGLSASGRPVVGRASTVSSGGGGNYYSGGAASLGIPTEQNQGMLDQTSALYDLISKQADTTQQGRDSMITRVLKSLNEQKSNIAGLPGKNLGQDKTALAEMVAGQRQQGLANASSNGQTLTPEQIDMINRSQMGALSTGMNTINESGRQAELQKQDRLSQLVNQIAGIEQNLYPEYNVNNGLALQNIGAQAGGYASQGAPAQTAAKMAPINSESGNMVGGIESSRKPYLGNVQRVSKKPYLGNINTTAGTMQGSRGY